MNEEVPDFVTAPERFDQVNASLALLCKSIADELERRYPGWLWAILPEAMGGGVLSIISLRLSGQWGYRFKLADIQGDPKPAMRIVMRGAGEILERFGVPRGTYRYEDWVRSPRYLALPMPDVSDKPHLIRKQTRDAQLDRALAFGTAGLRIRDTGVAGGTYREVAVKLCTN